MRPLLRVLRSGSLVLAALMAAALTMSTLARAQSAQQALETLASNMAPRLVRQGEGTLTLVFGDLPNLRGEYCGMGRFVAERLTTQLSTTQGLKVLERSVLAQALLEMKLAQADLADKERAKQVGLRIGAQAVAVGGLADVGNTVEMDVRVIKLDSGETLFAGHASFPKTQGLEALMQKDCGRGVPPATAAGGASGGSTPATDRAEAPAVPERALTGSEPIYENGVYKVTFESVRKSGSSVIAVVGIENISKAPIKFAVRNNSYLIDENGDRWDQAGPDTAALWAWGDSFGLPDLIPGLKRRTRIEFKSTVAATSGKTFTLVAKEFRPQEGRTVSLAGIQASPDQPQGR